MRLTSATTHTVWDNSLPPVAEVGSGATLEVEVANSSGGQLGPDSVVADVGALDFSRVNPVTGPVYVGGAMPGDTLVVEVLDVVVADWGWTANIPGFGLLSDDFPDAALRHAQVAHGWIDLLGRRLPAVPMIGTIGVAPAEPGSLPMVPPHRHGGNMDIRHITAGTTLRLPVGAPGALLSLGDTHAAMGDGEVCGTGVEIASTVSLRVSVETDAPVPTAVLETDGRAARTGPSLISTGIGPDLRQAARDATRSMIEQLVRRTGLAPLDAYLLVSVTGDLHISEIVDLPNVVVSMHVPLTAVTD